MSLWIRSTLLVAAMLLMTGAALADCTYLGGSPGGTYSSGRSITIVYTHHYNCDGEIYSVTVSETFYDMDGNGTYEPSGWQQTTTGGGRTVTTWGVGEAPRHGSGSTFDPRRGLAEDDPEY
jgi:hypothetical protein